MNVRINNLQMRDAKRFPPTEDGEYMAMWNTFSIHCMPYAVGGGWNCHRHSDGTVDTEHAFPDGGVIAWCTRHEYEDAMTIEAVIIEDGDPA